MLRVIAGRFRRGRVTERDPRGGDALEWAPVVRDPTALAEGVCPTPALSPKSLELGACIFCHACGRSGVVDWRRGLPDVGATTVPLVAGARADELPALQERLKNLTGVFGRSLAIRHLDVGSCNGCDVEIQATTSPYVDLERFGIRFVASPRHADILLVTGVVTRNLAEALIRTVEATPEPRAVVALGACGMTGGIFAGSPHVLGGVHTLVPVDVVVPGCPPPPEAILAGILDAAMILSSKVASGRAPELLPIPQA